jgi:hypothetical protein
MTNPESRDAVPDAPRTVPTHLDALWADLWEDLRHNATGKPSGDRIIARHRHGIEAEARQDSLDEVERLRAATTQLREELDWCRQGNAEIKRQLTEAPAIDLIGQRDATIEVLRSALEAIHSETPCSAPAFCVTAQTLANLPESSTEYAKHARLGAAALSAAQERMETVYVQVNPDGAWAITGVSQLGLPALLDVLTQGESNAD